MKTALYEFMPYGAPELIEARSRHLSRALVLACATAIAVLGAAFGIGSLIPEKTLVILPPDSLDPHQVAPQPINPRPPLAPQQKVIIPDAPVAPKIAIPVPVPDAKAPVVNEAPPAGPTSPTGDPNAVPSTPSNTATPGDAIPRSDEYVYVERLPEPIKQVKPEYTDIATRAGVQGLVRVKVLVGKDGHVMDAQVDDKIQIPLLNDAALAAARKWIFTPGTTNGQPVICWVSIPFNFRLH